ncbi:MAG TPA: SWIM zinc finger family protein [Nitrososphaera sp.]|nr:SWIM zinc finger family protein [Nitrososphaera sp.]
MDLNPREAKALEIADRFRIAESSGKWIVPSQSHPTTKYGVRIVGEYAECDCPDFELRRDLCKHILAIKLVIKREHNGDGLRSRTDTAMVNEALCKILCHNLSVLIHEIHELGIECAFDKGGNR